MIKILSFLLLFVASIYGKDLNIYIDDNFHTYDKFDLMFLKDESSALTIEDIQDYEFTNHTDNRFNLGYTKGNLWLKLNVLNTGTKTKYIISLNETFYEKANLYYIAKDGQFSKISNGVFTPIIDRDIKTNHLAFEVDIPAFKEQSIYLELQGKYAYFGNITLKEKEYFVGHNILNTNSLYLVVVGVIFTIIIFNLFVYLRLKEKIYLYYLGYAFFNFIYILNISGILVYLNLQTYMYDLHFSSSFMIGFFTLFSLEYLNTKRYLRRYDIFLKALSIPFFILGMLILYSYTPWNKVINNLAGVISIALIVISIIVYFKGHHKTKYYTFTMLFYLIFVFLFTFMVIGIVEYNYLSRYGFVVASALEMMIFSLLLSSRYSNLRDENEAFLEKRVKERTLKLNEKYDRIQSLLGQKEVLLKEVHHRVKNNYHMLMGLLWLEEESNQDNSKLQNIRNRIKSMSLIHEKLHKSNDIANIPMKEYLKDIINNILSSYSNRAVSLDYNVQDITLEYEIANSLGIIVNEVVNNSIKHNPNSLGLILEVKLTFSDNSVALLIKDNGNGFEEDMSRNGIGMSLIESFSKKFFDSHYEFIQNNGVEFRLTFQKERVEATK